MPSIRQFSTPLSNQQEAIVMKKLLKTAVAAALVLGANISIAEVKVGIAAEPYPPFMEKAADGTWVGWEIEIINAVCAAMEEECEIVPVAWDGIIPALMSKKFDTIMASMSITEERMKTIDFSDKYYNTPAAIIAAVYRCLPSMPTMSRRILASLQAPRHMPVSMSTIRICSLVVLMRLSATALPWRVF